jgi:tetratricopeptide (TPR) repeat protein
MKIKKNFSLDEILTRLRGIGVISSRTTHLPHLSWEEIFEYLERRYELPSDNPLKRRVLNHIIECRQCHNIFSYAHDLMTAIESDSIPESTEESKQQAYEIVLHAPISERVLEEVSEITAVSQEENKVIEELVAKSEELRRIVARSDARLLILQIGLAKRPNIHRLDNFIDPIASVKGDSAIGIVSAKLINLSQILEARSASLIIPCTSNDLGNFSVEPIPEIPIKYETDIIPIKSPDEEEKNWQARAEFIGEPVSAVLMRGFIGEVKPGRWLGQAGYITSNPHPAIDVLEQARDLITPIDPYKVELVGWDKAEYFTAFNERIALRVLEEVARRQNKTTPQMLEEHFSRVTHSVFSKESEWLDEDAKLTARHLYALILRGYRGVAQRVLGRCLFGKPEYRLKPAYRLVDYLDGLNDSRYLTAWAKICGKLGVGRTDEARDLADHADVLFEKAIEKAPDNLYIRTTQAKVLTEQGRFEDANSSLAEAWNTMRDEAEKSPSFLMTRGYALLKMGGRDDEAKKFLEKAFEASERTDPRPLHLLGLCHEHRGEFGEARKKFELIFQELDGKNVHALHAWGKMASERGHLFPTLDAKVRGAEELFKEVLEIEPANVFALVELGRVYSVLAERDKDKEAYSEAVKYFQQALDYSPNNSYALTSWAELDIEYHKDEEWNEELSQKVRNRLDKAEAVAGKEPAIETLYAKLERKEKKLDEALDRLEVDALQSNLIANNMRMQILWERNQDNDREKVRRHFEDIKDLGRFEDITGSRHIITNRSELVRSINTYADLLAKAEKFEEAEDWYKHSLEYDKENAYTLLEYGLMLKKWLAQVEESERRKEAIKHLKEAERLGLPLRIIKQSLQELSEG